jgi:hypothetical protein
MTYSNPGYFPTERLVEVNTEYPMIMDEIPRSIPLPGTSPRFGEPTPGIVPPIPGGGKPTPGIVPPRGDGRTPLPDLFPTEKGEAEGGKEGGFLNNANRILDVVGELVKQAVNFKRGYEGTPLAPYGGDGRRMASQQFLAQILEAQRERNDRLREEDLKERLAETRRRENVSVARDLFEKGELSRDDLIRTIQEGKLPDLTKPIEPLKDFDYAARGGPGFGMKDLEDLQGRVTYEQMQEIARRAPGGRIGPEARRRLGIPEAGSPAESQLF